MATPSPQPSRADIALLKKLVRCKHWSWQFGMLTHETHPPSPLRLSEGYCHDFRDSVSERRFGPFNEYGRDTYEDALLRPLPDLTDPGTRGCVLELVRQAWGDPGMSVTCEEGRRWHVRRTTRSGFCETVATGTTEGKALAAALLAAP